MPPEVLDPENEDLEDYYRAYFGSDADYYLQKLTQYEAGVKITFNLGAFFFGIFWMLYRKLYIEALVALLVISGLPFLTKALVQSQSLPTGSDILINNIFTIVWSLLLGFGGNWLYILNAKRKVAKGLRQETNDTYVIAKLQRQGGITLIPHIILAAIVLLSLLMYRF
ncbi:DUF2628 domain-containing protein [Sabulibacter ruber]|uniref:DUF2628 domain-containing protein n=1 Tax=Sabulibacter ruber TaxID=2811901 RepID=UPI001A96FE65|nr:DUF2628 domain-containing protein [Sabulibacter ruber]